VVVLASSSNGVAMVCQILDRLAFFHTCKNEVSLCILQLGDQPGGKDATSTNTPSCSCFSFPSVDWQKERLRCSGNRTAYAIATRPVYYVRLSMSLLCLFNELEQEK